MKPNSLRFAATLLITFTTIGFSVSLDAAKGKITPRKGMNLVGRVTVDGKPRKGVVVSDGINVVVTDRKGEYQMDSQGRQHVFVSVPADCEIPVSDDGFPRFYRTITPSSGSNQYDFDLKSAPVKTEWNLVAIADPQIGPADTLDYATVVMPQIREYVSTLSPNTYGIALGDLVWNAPQLYPTYKRHLSTTGIPVFSVIGNHDHNKHIHNDTGSDIDFRNHLGPTYYSVNIGDCHLIALDDVYYRGVKNHNDYAAHLTCEQLEWLRQDLEHVDHDKTIIIGVHIPTMRRNSRMHVDNNAELYSILKPFRRVEILSGHTHNQMCTHISSNIHETTFGAAMGAFWYPLCNDGSPRGIGVLSFKGPELTDRYYIGAGMSRDYQMNLYGPEEAVLWNPESNPGDSYDKVLLNLFCWGEDWLVEVSEDGKPWYRLPDNARLIPAEAGGKCWDPGIRKHLVRGRIPSRHGAGERPQSNNDHLFLITPAEGWSSVSVRATDPFGNIYTRTINNNNR